MVQKDFKNLEKIANTLKRNTLLTIDAANTGHLGACCSSNELLTALYFTDILQINSKDPKDPNRDYVLLRGHLGPLRYNLFQMLGWLKKEEMLDYRKFGSRLCGHEDMNITPGVDITPSGSLGMVLSYAVGARLSFKERDLKNRVFCFLGDGEEQEGNVSEAARHASNLNLDNLIVIIDKNTKQLSTITKYTDGGTDLRKTWEGYGWNVLEIMKGHDLREIYDTYQKAVKNSKKGPVCVIAHTIKGNGIRGSEESYNGYHVYHNTSEDQKKNAVPIKEEINRLSNMLKDERIVISKKNINRQQKIKESNQGFRKVKPEYTSVASSYEYFQEFIKKLILQDIDKKIYFLTADYPPRNLIYERGEFSIAGIKYINTGIREQHLFSMAHGIKTVEKNALVLIFCGDAFIYRSADQINVLAQSNDDIIIYSVESGLSSAKNGPTHQSSGQPGMILTMPNIKIYEPASKLDWFYIMNKAVTEHGLKYIRLTKVETPFDFGGFKEGSFYEIPTAPGSNLDCTIATNGLVVPQAVKASKKLYEIDNIKPKLINIISPKDVSGIAGLVEQGKPLFIFYNGNPDVLSYPLSKELVKEKNSVSDMITVGFGIGKTGSIKEVMNHFNLDSETIYRVVKEGLWKS